MAACDPDTAAPGDLGSIEVTATTTGVDLDPDGYAVTTGGSTQPLAINGTATFSDLGPGTFSVQLAGIADNCDPAEPNPQSADVTAGATTGVTFTISCRSLTASQELTAAGLDSLESALFRALNAPDTSTVGSDILDRITFAPAKDLFAQALAIDTTNETAAFGLAVTAIFGLEDDPAFRSLVDRWDEWLADHDLAGLPGPARLTAPVWVSWQRARLPLAIGPAALRSVTGIRDITTLPFPVANDDGTFPPTLREHQDVLRDIAQPAIETALAALETLDDPTFTFAVTPAMQGEEPQEADPLELDFTEVLALQSALEVALASIDFVAAYVLEPSPYGDGLPTAMAPGSAFLTLASGGGVRLAEMQGHAVAAVDRMQESIAFLRTEVDDQSDDIIKIDATGNDGVRPTDLDEAERVLIELESALQGPRLVTDDFGRGQVTIQVDLSQFFANHIADLKSLLPAYTVAGGAFHWTAQTIDEWQFPLPDFNGVLPRIGSTDDLLEIFDLTDLYQAFRPPLAGTLSVTPNGATLSAISAQQIFTAALVDPDGRPIDGIEVVWSSLNPQVATVESATGTVTAMTTGQAILEARAEDLRAYAVVTVSIPGAVPATEITRVTLSSEVGDLHGVWTAGTTFLAAGDRGSIVRTDSIFDWNSMAVPSLENLAGVWGVGAADAYAIGANGTVLRFDGTDWTPTLSGTTVDFSALWAPAPDDLFAVSRDGSVLRSAGERWTPGSIGATNLEGVWGSSASNVFVVGAGGFISRYDGATWTRMTSGTTEDLRGVWGSSSSDIHAVGAAGTALRFDGSTWSANPTNQTATLDAVWGTAAGDVYAVGDGVVLRFDGAAWTAMVAGDPVRYRGVWGTFDGPVFAVGNALTILRLDRPPPATTPGGG